MSEVRDVIVVGSGPAGWTAAIYTARAGLEPLVIAGALEAGGALMNTTEVENFPGWPDGILGPDLMEKLQSQAEKFGAKAVFTDATALDLTGSVKRVTTDDGVFEARTVILALGSAYRKLNVPGEEEFSGKGVSYCATCDGFFFRNQEIAVVGGGDSAATEALFLSRFGSTVHLIHRRDQLRASKVLADRIAADPKIKVHWNSKVIELKGSEALETAVLEDTVTGEKSQLPVAGLFVSIGHLPRSGVVKDQITCDHGGYILTEEPSTRTNLPGIFACGDVVDHTYRQAITAAGSGCKAALDAQNFLEEQRSHE
ncbi:MAG: thioredoxin-disulfide reductase [Ancrocorticia sp.]|jgi:thioredoxin reductase (NADPH)|nr:thioredoxin-disulfide reductase [Ancrocorticia sp.]MCI1932830.1 thioredoxin-disulfide reductase [Ancrocorticia sp.]MCI1963626.1 thioredoxin-disulfide reductase [Ancrocorticia sp.]MCI2002785.1 thioredoxin-disulfide reductase [Ancrocorticia sp.]MCI2012105.1 thioredoxin-disulfide reductase [Ancrocorticia sp.]